MHDLVIFDCDGVLVDSEPLSNQVMIESLARYGLPLTMGECMALFVGTTMAKAQEIAQEMGANLPDAWIDEVYRETYARLRDGVPLVPGARELLMHLEAKAIPYCVASNGHIEKMQITLGQNDLWDRFQGAMFSAYTVGVGKPDPTMFLTAARHFGAKSPVVIEDSASGATAAIRAGMRCLGYAAHDDGAQLAEIGAEVFSDMAEVPALLGI
ncbi:HAD family phosphatase [Ruegeria sp. Ofav3-42]|uniref:HAD family hydrolase n=1 Tax=Ruegeria sp. Ofav3-42 TaxID=2917759 RepID=UPI001EF73B6E|nr:HAD family phosphatase [Ruegeria sp. Ofav3-42]MCG7521071.1 HAD family phosphatase [Ruegeria sp. Ofav3-42]